MKTSALGYAIPTRKFPSIKEYEIKKNNEPIVSLKERGFLIDSQYYKQGIPGSYKDCYARKSVAEKLKIAEEYLPNGFRFMIYDAYRPICVQQRLWNFYHQKLKNENPGISEEELDFKTSFFVSKPSYDVMHPSLHNTGGAIDLTICNLNGESLNMGTEFDDFSDKAWTNHFEEYEKDIVVRDNRRLLYNVMTEAGFTNLPSEWWHYDYGDKFWAHFTNNTAMYEGIIDMDLPERFPLS